MKVAAIGECMIELLASGGTSLTQFFGGDTLNTAIYLKRLGISTDYLTALGDDRFSDEMIRLWTAEGGLALRGSCGCRGGFLGST